MRNIQIKLTIGIMILLTVGIALWSTPSVRAAGDNRAPELPADCDIAVEAGHKVIAHVYAKGVQIYRWDGFSWVFVAPVATLFADANFRGQVGIHYRGPTWEDNGGSIVKAGSPLSCIPDSNAIPWLRLTATFTSGPGIFSSVTFVHRVNTTGGLKPTDPGLSVGDSVEVPYTAEYYFYREQN